MNLGSKLHCEKCGLEKKHTTGPSIQGPSDQSPGQQSSYKKGEGMHAVK